LAEEEEKRNGRWEQPKESFWHGVKYIIGGIILLVIFPLKQIGMLCVSGGVILVFLLAPYQLFVAWREKKNEGKPKSPSLWQRYLDWVDRMING